MIFYINLCQTLEKEKWNLNKQKRIKIGFRI